MSYRDRVVYYSNYTTTPLFGAATLNLRFHVLRTRLPHCNVSVQAHVYRPLEAFTTLFGTPGKIRTRIRSFVGSVPSGRRGYNRIVGCRRLPVTFLG